MKKNKRTQGTFFIDAGDTISELLLRVEIKEDGNTELFDICDFSADETGNVKANAAFICEAVNNYDKLKEDNALLLDALKGLYEFNLGKSDYLDTLLNNAESAIHKAEIK